MIGVLASAVLLTGTTVFASFCWAARFHFRPGRMPLGMKLISVASIVAFVMFGVRLWLRSSEMGCGVALAFIAGSGLLFGWTLHSTRQDPPGIAFSTVQPERLFCHGPYRLLRHPFYASYLLFWLATCLAAPGISGWMALAVLTALYVEAIRREEGGFAQSPLRGAYEDYRKTTGVFLPRLGSLLRSNQHRART